MAVSEELKALVAQMPDPDDQGMLTRDIDKDKIEKAVAAIFQGGRASVQGLVEMLREPGTPEDVKPHYALHCVLNRALMVRDENARRQFCETLAANLSGDLSAYNKAYLCQELQWAGRREAVSALGKLLMDERLCDPAGMALAAIGDGAAQELVAALPRATGRCRLVIAHTLAALAAPQSAGTLLQLLGDSDPEVRVAAGAGLAKIGDARTVGALLKAADTAQGWEGIQATKHCLILAERLMAAGNRAQAVIVYRHLRDTRRDPSEKYVRDAAERALGAVRGG